MARTPRQLRTVKSTKKVAVKTKPVLKDAQRIEIKLSAEVNEIIQGLADADKRPRKIYIEHLIEKHAMESAGK
jgi:RecB family exonuclease